MTWLARILRTKSANHPTLVARINDYTKDFRAANASRSRATERRAA